MYIKQNGVKDILGAMARAAVVDNDVSLFIDSLGISDGMHPLNVLDVVFSRVKADVGHWVSDPYGEVIPNAGTVLRQGGGDADDIALLVAAVLRSVGFDVRFKAVSVQKGRECHHVYVQAFVDGNWVALDPLYAHSVGEEPAGIEKAMTYKL